MPAFCSLDEERRLLTLLGWEVPSNFRCYAEKDRMLRFHIANMNCSGCAKGVAAALQNAGAGLEPCFDLEKREVTVEARDEEAARFTTALVQDGWEARLLSLPQHKGTESTQL